MVSNKSLVFITAGVLVTLALAGCKEEEDYVSPAESAEICNAAKSGDLGKLKAMLSRKPVLIKTQDAKNGHSPLYDAASMGHLKVVEFLVSKGAEVEVGDNLSTPLYVAASAGHKEVVDFLISKGAKVNILADGADPEEPTPLHVAVNKGYRDIVESLLANGALVNVVNRFEGKIPLHYACGNGQVEIVELLLAYGVKGYGFVNTKDNLGRTALHDAACNGHKDVVKLLHGNAAKVYLKDEWDRRPLHFAAEMGHTQVVELLIGMAGGRHLNDKDKSGLTPLRLAIDGGHDDTADLLRKYGAVE